MKRIGLGLLVGAGCVGQIVLADAATAQEATGELASETGIAEITVTAQKRLERLQDVPISITALRGDELDSASVSGTNEALSRVPGVAVTQSSQGGGTQVTVRGVTAGGPLFTGSSPVAYYLDSVPFGLVKTAIAPDSAVYDLDRIEVLRGPQGTLYGASAQNGVVRVLTKDADLREFEVKARGSMASTRDGGESYQVDAALNVPLIEDKLGVRIVAGYQDLGGWIDRPNSKDANDSQVSNLRLKVNAKPVENLAIALLGWRSRGDYGAPAMSPDGRSSPNALDESYNNDFDLLGLRAAYDFGAFTLNSATSYLRFWNYSALDVTPFGLATTLTTDLDADVKSEEVVLSSNAGGRGKWTLGGFYRDAEDRLRQNSLGGGAPFDFSNLSRSYAFFGEIGYRFLGGKLEATAGLRYFHDRVTVRENVSQGAPGDPLIGGEDKYDATTPRFVMSWFPSANATIYASWSQGFRSGFDQDPIVLRSNPGFASLQPDRLHNFELGAKSTAFDGALYLEAALYHIRWKDVQQSLSVPAQGTFVSALVNGEQASGIGVDLLASVRPVSGLDLTASLSWNNLEMDEDVFSSGALLFAKGDRLNLSPEMTAAFATNYRFALSGVLREGFIGASANYTSKLAQRTIFVGQQSVGEGDDLLTARIQAGVAAASGITLTAYVDNLTDERGAAVVQALPISEWTMRIRPRTFGLQAEVRF